MQQSKHSAAHRIFHYLYKCYIPQHHLYSRDYLDTFGIPTTGDREVDKQLANSPTLCQLSIADMAEHFANGANMSLENPRVSVEIYETVREHLVNWQRIVQDPLDTTEPPLDDLRKLDEFAGEVYKIARGYMEKDQTKHGIFKGISALESRRAMSRKETADDTGPKMPVEHTPISDTIAKVSFQHTNRWR